MPPHRKMLKTIIQNKNFGAQFFHRQFDRFRASPGDYNDKFRSTPGQQPGLVPGRPPGFHPFPAARNHG